MVEKNMNYFIHAEVPYIHLFGIEHLFYFLIIIFLLSLVIIFRLKIILYKKTINTILLSLSIFQQILLYGWYFFILDFDLSQALPLHLCRISTILGIIYLVKKNNTLMDFVFYYGLFTYFSFLLPFNIYPPYHVMGISYLINHSITLLLPIIAWTLWDWRPKLKNLPLVILGFIIYFAIVSFTNQLVDGNYFYLVNQPLLQSLPTIIYNSVAIIVTILGFILAYIVVSRYTHSKQYILQRYKLIKFNDQKHARFKQFRKQVIL